MSFAAEVKNELAHLPFGKACCCCAEAAGFFRAAGSIRRVGGGGAGGLLGFVVTTGNLAVARRIRSLFFEVGGVRPDVDAYDPGAGIVPKRYELHAPVSERATAFLETIGVLDRGGEYTALLRRMPQGLLGAKCCRKAFLRGMFLGAGSVSDPENSYHFEIVTDDPILAADTRRTMNAFTDIHAGISRRKGRSVVYLKSSEQIKDMLGIIGADRHLLAYEDVRMIHEMKDKANRISNCDNANVDRALRSGAEQAEVIRRIARLDGGAGLAALPPKLHEAARVRLENPEASLAEIGAMFDPPVSKPAAAARYRALAAIAERKEA
ncbi:MAG: DNA-binding protein WhiA [Clostridiales Family XIII bacterium]|nr:DNA-binding protein WhiA [Clostridiales Family XIII bacterium]